MTERTWRDMARALSGCGLAPYSAIVYIDGDLVIAEDPNGRIIAQGEAGVDDAKVIQSAVNVGGKIFIAEGEYLIDQTLTVDQKDDVQIIGVGMPTLKTVGAIRLLEVKNSSNFLFEGFVCDFNNDGLNIHIHRTSDFDGNMHNIIVRNIEKKNQNKSDARGILVWDEDHATKSYGVYDVIIENIYTHDNATTGGEEVQLAGVRNGIIRNVWAINNGRPSITLYLCENCKIERVWTDHKIWISGINCGVEYAYMFGEYPLELRSRYDLKLPSYNLFAKKCYLTGTKEIRINADTYDIYNVAIEECYIVDSVEEGITIEGSGKVYNPVIKDCYITGATNHGIAVTAENYNLVIENCYIAENGVDGIRLLSGNYTKIIKCTVKNNQQSGDGTVGIRNRGVNTQILYCDIYDDQDTPTQTTFLRNEDGNVSLMIGGYVTGSLAIVGGSVDKIINVKGYTTESSGSGTVTIPIGGGSVTTSLTTSDLGLDTPKIKYILNFRIVKSDPPTTDIYAPQYGINASEDAVGITLAAAVGTTLTFEVRAAGY